MDADSERGEGAAWFRAGLRFECQNCGRCCRGKPGFVWVSASEIVGIAGYLRMSPGSFGETHLRSVGEKTSLVEKANGDCIFWENGIGCRIYPLRPAQCRAFPFWRQNLESPEVWETVAQTCAGIGRGKLFTAREIVKRQEKTW